MKKPTSKIREEIAKLEDALKIAETRDAERIGRIALKAGLGDVEIEETELRAAFDELAKRFRGGKGGSTGRERAAATSAGSTQTAAVSPGAAPRNAGEA